MKSTKVIAAVYARGFTLIEIMVALAITAAGIAAVMKVVTNSADIMGELDDRMVASWVASNQLTERRISPLPPRPGTDTERVQMGGRTWEYREEITQTPDSDVYRLNIEVRRVGERDQAPLASVFGFIVSPPAVVVSRVEAVQ